MTESQAKGGKGRLALEDKRVGRRSYHLAKEIVILLVMR